MKKAAISLSFDDARGDNRDAFKNILIPMNLPATLNVTTGYVDGSCPKKYRPSSKEALTLEEIKAFGESPLVELALHGDAHLNTEQDIAACKRKLASWLQLPEDYAFGFASPGSGLANEVYLQDENGFFKKNTLYLRTSLRNKRLAWLKVLCRKAGRILHIPFLYRIAYADTLMFQCPDRIIYSIPVMRDAMLPEVLSVVKLAIRRKAALTLMFHSITAGTQGEDNWSWDQEKFIKLCRFLDQKRQERLLDVVTTKDIFCQLRGEIQ